MKQLSFTLLLILISVFSKAQNWAIVPTPLPDYFNSCSYGSATHVYVTGSSSILKSTNGGLNFTQLSTTFLPNSYINSCFFTSQDTGFIVGQDSNSFGFIFKTINGGASWTLVLSNAPEGFNAITFPSSQVGYAIGGFSTGYIYKTIDGGNTWLSIYTSPPSQYYYLSNLHFTDDNSGHVVGLYSTSLTDEALDIKISGGAVTSTTINPNYYINTDVHFTSTDTGYITAIDFSGSYILKTTNGGNTWLQVYSNFNDDITALDFMSNTNAYAIGTFGTIIKTTNSGANWNPVLSPTNQDLNAITMYDSTNGIIVGDGTILKLVVCTGVPSSASITIPPACDYVIENGQVYSSSGTYTQLFINSVGCDSILTLNVTINNSSYNYIFANSCVPYIFNGVTYNSTGFYTVNFINSQGCDSIIDLDLIINSASSSSSTINSCNAYTWNGNTYTVSGTYTNTIINAAGCDSLMTLNLTLNSLNAGLTQVGPTLTASPSGASSYQWLLCPAMTPILGATNNSYTAIFNGNFAVKVTQSTCSDTSVCKTVTGVDINEFDQLDGISIYPNPTNGRMLVQCIEPLANASAKVINLTGQVIWQQNSITEKEFDIDISSKANGIYFVEIKSESTKKIQRFKICKE